MASKAGPKGRSSADVDVASAPALTIRLSGRDS